MIKLIKPCKELEKEIFEYQQEMIDFGDTNLDGCGSLEKYNNFEEWEEHLNSYAERKNLDPKSSYVEGSQYLLFDNEKNRVIGMVNLRHYLNVYLSQFGGHIGYSIRPSERRKGYGKLQLQLAIKKLREITQEKILITCDHNNLASSKIIESCGGVLENEVYSDKENNLVKRYWIE